MIPYNNDPIAFHTGFYLMLYDFKSKKFEEQPINMEYEIKDAFNLHFDFVKTRINGT